MPEPRPARPSRPTTKTGGRATSSSRTPNSGFGKTSDQGRGAAKRRQDSPSGRSTRRREADDRVGGSARGRGGDDRSSGRPATGRGRTSSGNSRFEEREAPMAPARKGWGSLTRKGAASMKAAHTTSSSREAERNERPREDRAKDKFVKVARRPKPEKTERIERPRFDIPDDAISEIEKRAGKRADRLIKYLKDAGTAYAAERWSDAKKSLRPLLTEVADAPVVQELHGMILYRQGKWAAAIKELEPAHMATRSYDLYPAIMDSYRALKKYPKVETLWEELRAESPGAEIVSEGRIVAAGALADQKKLQEGIQLLEKAPRPKSSNTAKEHHLRAWYVLADLYDRAGETSKARAMFQKVAKHDPELADVVDRLEGLD